MQNNNNDSKLELSLDLRLFAIYLIMLGWKTCKFYYETEELANPRPTQPKKTQVESGIWVTFSHSEYFFVGWDWFYIGNRLREIQPNQIIRQHRIVVIVLLLLWYVSCQFVGGSSAVTLYCSTMVSSNPIPGIICARYRSCLLYTSPSPRD